MKTWALSDARAHFDEILQFCDEEPQMVYEHNVPRAVIVDIHLFRELTEGQFLQQRPTISQLLEELQEIHILEPIEIEIPARQDRLHIIDKDENGIFM